ncbi:MAG: nucleoside phosphorylase [Chloroflexi bacterium]|nr:nucleoside phosphorylase [Chloroflexota bacterium]
MSKPRFTPHQAVEHRLKARGLSFDDMRVGKKVLLVWTRKWSEILADTLGAEPVPQTMFGDTFWLRTTDNDRGGVTVAFAPIGAPGTIMMMEDLIACGAESFVGVGASGGLDPRHPIGDVLLPNICRVIDEGTSGHYPDNGQGPPSADRATLADLTSLLEKHGARTASGDWWTTDGFYREMTDDIARRASNGILGIDMETSAMYRVAQYRGVTACNMLVVSDELWTEWNYGIDFSEFKSGVEAMHAAAVEWAQS